MYIPPSILDHDSLKTEVDALRGYINRIAPEALVRSLFQLNSHLHLDIINKERCR